jgi:hypothetical protein
MIEHMFGQSKDARGSAMAPFRAEIAITALLISPFNFVFHALGAGVA